MNLEELSSNLSNNFFHHINDVMKTDFLKSLENFLSKGGKEIEMIETASVDRIENNFVVCELSDQTILNVPINKFNFDIHESDIVKLNLTYEDGKISDISVISKDDNEKNIRQNIINEKFNNLRNNS